MLLIFSSSKLPSQIAALFPSPSRAMTLGRPGHVTRHFTEQIARALRPQALLASNRLQSVILAALDDAPASATVADDLFFAP